MRTTFISFILVIIAAAAALGFGALASAGGTSDEAPFANEGRAPLVDKWNFVVGTEQWVEDFAAQHECVTAIWQYSNVNGWTFWRAYFPKSLDENGKDYFAIRYLFIDEAYWIYCDGGE